MCSLKSLPNIVSTTSALDKMKKIEDKKKKYNYSFSPTNQYCLKIVIS